MVEEIINTNNKSKVKINNIISNLELPNICLMVVIQIELKFRTGLHDPDQSTFGMFWMFRNGCAGIAVIIIKHTMKNFYM